MRLIFGSVFLFCAVVVSLLLPHAASAQTISITQTITITATVAPARSIVINDQGQITKIYSNTAENVTPNVYVNEAPTGQRLPLTADLRSQYEQIISKQKNLAGVAIPVAPPVADNDNVRNFLMKNISTFIRPFHL